MLISFFIIIIIFFFPFFFVVDALIPEFYSDGSTIVKQGEEGSTFYILEKGECKIEKDGIETENSPLASGDYFGEIALLHHTTRKASIVAKGDVK